MINRVFIYQIEFHERKVDFAYSRFKKKIRKKTNYELRYEGKYTMT